MASAFSHALVAVTLGRISERHALPWHILLLGTGCSIAPDLDVIGFHFGIHYGDLWGHRGLTHSFFFAGLLSAALVAILPRHGSAGSRTGLFFYFFLCTASHGVLDALTDGGLGVAFFSPFDTTRYFFAVRPVAVSPIGVSDFFTADALRILASEVMWIWLPTVAAFLTLRAIQRLRFGRPAAETPRAE
jgi:inner membrane protein